MQRLIIVEDEKMIRQGLHAMIARSGLPIEEIIECKNGLEALEVIGSQKVDVVITDIRMPKMDGVTLVKELSQLEVMPQVIVISGFDDFGYAVELLRYGAREYLLKPIEREELIGVLNLLEEEIIEQEIEEQLAQEKKKLLVNKHFKLFLEDPCEEKKELLKMNDLEWVRDTTYWVYCSNHQEEEYFDTYGTIYIEGINGQDFWIVINEKGKTALETFLRCACYGISKGYEGIDQLEVAYKEAIESRKGAFFMTKYHNGEYINDKKDWQQEVIGIVSRITQLVGTERFQEAIKLLGVLQCKVERCKMSQAYFEEMMSSLLSQIKETYREVLRLDACTHLLLEEMYRYSNLVEYMEVFSEFLLNLHNKISDGMEDYKNKQKMQQAIDYIQQNYTKDLNMAVVSNHISMNYSLFSLVFKEYTGMSFVSYVKELRISEAKKLLTNTDKKINEISTLVGYENEKHFMKVFKTLYGVSPSEYRRNTQVGNSCKK